MAKSRQPSSSPIPQQEIHTPFVWEKIVASIVAVLIFALVGLLVIRNEPFSDPNLVVILRIVLSVAAAVLGATIPGFLRVDWNVKGIVIRAGGALALFALTFLWSPNVVLQPYDSKLQNSPTGIEKMKDTPNGKTDKGLEESRKSAGEPTEITKNSKDITASSITLWFSLPKGDNKDDNTSLTCRINKENVPLASKIEFANGQEFNDPGEYGPFSLDLKTKITKDDFLASTTTLWIQPHGGREHDTVIMNTIVTVEFTDGTKLESQSSLHRYENASSYPWSNNQK